MERVRLVEETVLKTAGYKSLAGSIPVLSVDVFLDYLLRKTSNLLKDLMYRGEPLEHLNILHSGGGSGLSTTNLQLFFELDGEYK